MTVAEILKRVHRKFAKDTDYPEAGSEDLLVRIDHLNDGISEWENKVREGVYWPELVETTTLSCGGTGTDALPSDFLTFLRKNNEDDDASALVLGSEYWIEMTPAQGARAVAEGLSPHIFWKEGTNLRTLPAISGSLPFTYVRKATRYTAGDESTEPEMADHSFLEDYTVAKVFLDNSDDTLYANAANSASDKLDAMVYDVVSVTE
jgi:hypothetical protein